MTFRGLRGFSIRLYTAKTGEFALCVAVHIAGFIVGLLSVQVCVWWKLASGVYGVGAESG